MAVERIVPILTVGDLPASVAKYTQLLEMTVVMDHGWIVTLADDAGRQLSLMTQDATAPVTPDVSIFVDDVHAAYADAQEQGVEIVHPLTDEPWGVTRFFLRDDDGNVVNIGMHRTAA